MSRRQRDEVAVRGPAHLHAWRPRYVSEAHASASHSLMIRQQVKSGSPHEDKNMLQMYHLIDCTT